MEERGKYGIASRIVWELGRQFLAFLNYSISLHLKNALYCFNNL